MTKKKLYTLSFLILCLVSKVAYSQRIKEFEIKKDAIIVVHTSTGYTTLLSFPTKPTRVVVGDQDSFRIEFVGNNLAIKPLVSGVKTNLFVFTRDEQYQCTLISGSPDHIQYLVRLENKTFESKKLNLAQKKGDVVLSLTEYRRHMKGKRHELFFEIANHRPDAVELNPSELQIEIGKKRIHMASVYLEKTQISPKGTVRGKILFFARQNPNAPLDFIVALKDQKLTYPFSARIF